MSADRTVNVQRQIDQLIALRAAQWYEQLKSDDDADDRSARGEFTQWLAESPRHLEAFLAIAGQASFIRGALQSGLAAGSLDLEKTLKQVSREVVPFPETGRAEAARQNPRRPTRNAAARAVACAAVAACTVGIGMFGWLFYSALSWQQFETPVGDQRTVQLPEGSVVNLNAASHVDVRFDDSQRAVRITRGEATFKVAADAARPFRVHTPGAVVEAVGTQFNVYARPDGTTAVAVLEGKVNVTGSRRGNAETVALAAGEEARVRVGGHIERDNHPDVAEAVAWQQRKLIFKGTPLTEMAAEFNRYNKSTQIRVENIDAGLFQYTGAFNADDPQSLAVLLEREPDLEVDRVGHDIVIRMKTPGTVASFPR